MKFTGKDLIGWGFRPGLLQAYKNADQVVAKVLPLGSIMAGDWERDAPWKGKKRRR